LVENTASVIEDITKSIEPQPQAIVEVATGPRAISAPMESVPIIDGIIPSADKTANAAQTHPANNITIATAFIMNLLLTAYHLPCFEAIHRRNNIITIPFTSPDSIH
jgi:hypothetical protein